MRQIPRRLLLRGLKMRMLTVAELKEILAGVPLGTLSRDELEHALEVYGDVAETDDRDSDLVDRLQAHLGS
jgi:hypothetical protein